MSFSTLPAVFGPYRLLARLGRGGMGDVFLAQHGALSGFEKRCVVKMLRDDRVVDDDALARFSDEARVVVQFNHRNICPVFDVGRVGARLYVAMERVNGDDLRAVTRDRPLPLPLALHVVSEVLAALDYAHHFHDAATGRPLGLVHRDVNPANVLLGIDGDVKLIDFGIAVTRDVAQRFTDGPNTVLGKLRYMAPEHARGDVVDARSDQWAAAAMLTELALHAPFWGELSVEQVWQRVGAGVHRPAGFATLPAGLRAILDRALSPAPADRFATAGELADALAAWSRPAGLVAGPRDLQKHLRGIVGDVVGDDRARVASILPAPARTSADVTLSSAAAPHPAAPAMAPASTGSVSATPHPAPAAPGLVEDTEVFVSIATTIASTPRSTRAAALALPLSPQTARGVDRSSTLVSKAAAVLLAFVVGAAGGGSLLATLDRGCTPARDRDVDALTAPTAPASTTATPTTTNASTTTATTNPSTTPATTNASTTTATTPPTTPATTSASTTPATTSASTTPATTSASTTTATTPATTPPTTSASTAPAARAPSFDPETRRLLDELLRCRAVVPCANGVLARRSERGIERPEAGFAASVRDCVRLCRLRR